MNQTIQQFQKQELSSGVTLFRYELHNFRVTAIVRLDEQVPEFYNVAVVVKPNDNRKGPWVNWGLSHICKAANLDDHTEELLFILAESTIDAFRRAYKK